MKRYIWILSFLVSTTMFSQEVQFSQEDSLQGNNTNYRNWWNVVYYDLHIKPNFSNKCIEGRVTMYFKVLEKVENQEMQIDLQFPLQIDKMRMCGSYPENYFDVNEISIDDLQLINFTTYNLNNNIHIVKPKEKFEKDKIYSLEIDYYGSLPIAQNPPWDGGWVFEEDENGNLWITATCEGDGASIWFPCKDYNGDEPDFGMKITAETPKNILFVSNGRLLNTQNKNTTTWYVKNPINLYNIIPYFGKYAHIQDTYSGLKGNLSLDYYVLEYHIEKAKQQFEQVKKMLKAFEYWFGAYPFYEDGYKIVETPHLGMEHQSAIAYGNGFMNGYCNGVCNDWSNTGIGLLWDFIIIHESGHEWFGNNITAKDGADFWIHEAFTSYSETLYTEYYFGKEKANDYVIGTRRAIQNDLPMQGLYDLNVSGSTDIYFKGSNVIHTLRQLIEDDEKFRNILTKMNKEFHHKTVTGKEIEDFWSYETGIDLQEFFDQYIRTTQIPLCEYYIENDHLFFKYENVIDQFDMPLLLNNGKWIFPEKKIWKSIPYNEEDFCGINKNFLVETKPIKL